MFKNLIPLRKEDHGNLRVTPIRNMGFTRSEIMIPIVIDEIADVAREYPIVFPVASKLPIALLGVEQDNNAYLSADGTWRASYIPAHIRHYPFALKRVGGAPAIEKPNGKSRRSSKKKTDPAEASAEPISMAVMIDVESHAVGDKEGLPIFDTNGELSASIKSIVELMQKLVRRQAVTAQLVSSIEAAGILVEREIRIQQSDGQQKRVTGLRLIDEKSLNSLGDEASNKLRKSGALPLVYASLLAWANFRQGPIGKSYPLPSASKRADDEIVHFE